MMKIMITKIKEYFVNLFSKPTEKRFIDDYEYNSIMKKREDKLNKILDKISKSGHDSLNNSEKIFLKNFQNK